MASRHAGTPIRLLVATGVRKPEPAWSVRTIGCPSHSPTAAVSSALAASKMDETRYSSSVPALCDELEDLDGTTVTINGDCFRDLRGHRAHNRFGDVSLDLSGPAGVRVDDRFHGGFLGWGL
jgi:hypothetical protein